MSDQYDLDTTWIKIFDGSGFMSASVQARGEVVFEDADALPAPESLKGHKVSGGGSFTYGGEKDIYARLADSGAEAQVTVTKTVGGGLTGFTSLAFVSVYVGGG